ncbi:MAG: sulfatase [Planctomycetes bacterium]|nr:sulfatase [Planctomycetota bacterium]
MHTRTMRVILLFICLSLVQATLAADRPNVLLICVDDLKPLLACYGDTLVKTPNVDRLAKRGMRFDMAYCNQAVCAPSRHALMLGLRPQTLGIYDLATRFRPVVPQAVSWPQHFKANGYRAEAMGKIYHVGHGNGDDKESWSAPHWPTKGNGVALYHDAANKATTADGRGASFESADVADTAYADGALALIARERITALKQMGTPWFLGVGFIRPHLPFVAPKRYWDLYQRSAFSVPPRTVPVDAPSYAPQFGGELRQYAGTPAKGEISDALSLSLIHGYHAAVSYMDAQLGVVLDALDASGQADNTIIVFWGDHGWHLGDHGMWCKHTNYEQAARIPLIIAGPGIKPGSATPALMETVDLYPTISALAGLPAPAKVDGLSQVEVLRGATGTRDHVIHVYPRGKRIGRAIRTARWRLVEWKEPSASPDTAELELYDYQEDPLETRNLAANKPEVIAELRAILAKHPEAKPQVKGDK